MDDIVDAYLRHSYRLRQTVLGDSQLCHHLSQMLSREHAPWALNDYGFRVIIAPSFADIFRNNCFQNGLLTITLDEAAVRGFMEKAAPGNDYRPTVDLETQTISDASGTTIPFEVDDFRRHSLLNGLDDIGLTLQHEDKIAAYERERGIG